MPDPQPGTPAEPDRVEDPAAPEALDATERPDPAERPDPTEQPDQAAVARLAARARRLAEVFGDVLPSTTADERDDRDRAGEPDPDAQLLADRPPHHDRDR